MSDYGTAALALERLKKARRILVTAHSSPDGDAIGSELAMAELANSLGIEVVVTNRDPAPQGLRELPGADRIVVGEGAVPGFPEDFDLVVTLECPDIDRPGLEGLDRLPILNIDHHRANEQYGEVNWVEENAPAVGEMVWRLFEEAGIQPSPAVATNAYVALSTDTGDFRYSNATGHAFSAAAAMVSAGADPEQVADWVHGRRSEAAVRLLGEALATLELYADGRIAIVSADPDAFRRAGAESSDTEGIVNTPRAIAGVQVVAFLKQRGDGPVRVSLRSKTSIDVCAVAATFGGGGHSKASGCTIHSDMSSAREQVRARLVEAVERES